MIHLFVGPTLAARRASELLPGVNLCPPVKDGDLLRLDPRPGDIVAIVDGLFHDEIAIRHKEILGLIDGGVHVCGASGMGALRAAELHPYGMHGIGTIFGMLIRGELEGDDEVSLLHGGASDGYQALSEALVDIRFHCRLASEAGVIDDEDAGMIVAAAGALSYDERAYSRVLPDAMREGLEASTSTAYLRFVQREASSVRRDDALALIRHLVSPAAAHPRETYDLAATHWFHTSRDAERGSRAGAGGFVSDRVVLNFIRIAARDYPLLHARVVLQELGAFYGEHRGVGVPDVEDLIDDLRIERGLQSEEAFVAWRSEHELRDDELGAWLARSARLNAVAGAPAEVGLERLWHLASEYAVALGLWREGEPPDAQLAQWLTVDEARELSSLERTARVAIRTFQLYPSTPLDRPFITELKLSGAFARARAMLVGRPPLPEGRPAAGAVLDWCAMRWGVHAVTPHDVLDRGLGPPIRHARDRSMTAPLARRARGFYARVRASGDFPLLTSA